MHEDTESIYNAVNTVIDKIYFCDAELNNLDEYVQIRPSRATMSTYDEIETSETLITAHYGLYKIFTLSNKIINQVKN